MGGGRKSSYSSIGGDCAEVGSWHTARKCNGGACVEVASGEAVVGVRDSQLGGGSPVLVVSAEAWTAFLATLKASA